MRENGCSYSSLASPNKGAEPPTTVVKMGHASRQSLGTWERGGISGTDQATSTRRMSPNGSMALRRNRGDITIARGTRSGIAELSR